MTLDIIFSLYMLVNALMLLHIGRRLDGHDEHLHALQQRQSRWH